METLFVKKEKNNRRIKSHPQIAISQSVIDSWFRWSCVPYDSSRESLVMDSPSAIFHNITFLSHCDPSSFVIQLDNTRWNSLGFSLVSFQLVVSFYGVLQYYSTTSWYSKKIRCVLVTTLLSQNHNVDLNTREVLKMVFRAAERRLPELVAQDSRPN